jgi:hypothetical protein
MRLTALRLHNVRRFAGQGVAVEEIGAGVNVLSAVNEFGKSTCFDALHALFFQPHTGTPGPVQALRPYSGGSPLVEADIVAVDGAFRLTKQFYGGRRAMVRDLSSGRLVAQADEAERFIAALVQGGTSGPAGLLWVRQGITGFERRGKADEEGEKRARESVLTSVQGEVESLTGGRRMAEAIAACEEERASLVTATGRPKAGGPYALALEARNALAETEQRLGAEVKALTVALDRRRALRARLAELEDGEAVAARERDFAAAEAALLAARTRGERLKTAEVEAALALSRRDAAGEALEDYRQACARMTLLAAREREVVQARDAAGAHRGEAARAGRAAASAVESAEREERETRALLTRLEKAIRAREAAEELERLRTRHAGAEAARVEIEASEAALKTLALPGDALPALEALESDILQRRAVLAARAPLLRVAYRAGVEAAIRVDGVALTEGAEYALRHGARLDIAGVGELALTLPAAEEGVKALEAAEAQRDRQLAALGLASLAEARRRMEAHRAGSATRDLARQRLALLAPEGLSALRESLARIEAEAGGTPGAGALAEEIKADPAALRTALVAAEARVAATRQAAHMAALALEAAQNAHLHAEQALAALLAEQASHAARMGPDGEREAEMARRAAAFAEAGQAHRQAEQMVEGLRAGLGDQAGAEARLARTRAIVGAAREEIARLRAEFHDLNGQIRTRSEEAIEEAWQEVRERLAEVRHRVAGFEHEVRVLTRLRDALEAARMAARDHYFAPVMRELRPLLGLLFEEATVTFDEETLLPRTVCRNGFEEPVAVLSGGMREQLAILTRLAFARLLGREGRPAPVILDDALVYSDDDRIERMFDALHRQASDQQIIVFSCRQRAFSRLGGHVLRMTPWTPEA